MWLRGRRGKRKGGGGAVGRAPMRLLERRLAECSVVALFTRAQQAGSANGASVALTMLRSRNEVAFSTSIDDQSRSMNAMAKAQ